MFDLLLFVSFFFFFHDEDRNFVSLSCNQTIYYIKANAISYSMCVRNKRNMLFSSCFSSMAHLVFHLCYIINCVISLDLDILML